MTLIAQYWQESQGRMQLSLSRVRSNQKQEAQLHCTQAMAWCCTRPLNGSPGPYMSSVSAEVEAHCDLGTHWKAPTLPDRGPCPTSQRAMCQAATLCCVSPSLPVVTWLCSALQCWHRSGDVSWGTGIRRRLCHRNTKWDSFGRLSFLHSSKYSDYTYINVSCKQGMLNLGEKTETSWGRGASGGWVTFISQHSKRLMDSPHSCHALSPYLCPRSVRVPSCGSRWQNLQPDDGSVPLQRRRDGHHVQPVR